MGTVKEYKSLVQKVYEEGRISGDRTGTGTRRIFGAQLYFDCRETLPVVTLKYTHLPAVIHELLWFISGSTNIRYLKENNIKIWDEWADSSGELGPVYGAQWRNAGGRSRFAGVDQLTRVIEDIKERPYSRRLIIDCWDPKKVPEDGLQLSPQENIQHGFMALAPCHMFMQFFVENGELSLQMYQRSVDVFLGLPFNIASYAILLNLVAQVTGLKPGTFIWTGGDIHIYNNHIPQVEEMLSREPKALPWLELNPAIDYIDGFKYSDITVVGYDYHPSIKGVISI